jgi:hypothetical protein
MRFVVHKETLDHVIRVSPANHHSTVAPRTYITAPEIYASPHQAAHYHILGLYVGDCVCSGTRLVVVM